MTKSVLFIAAAFGLSSCAVLGPYSYDVYSDPGMPKMDLKDQIKETNEPVSAPLDSVCHLQTTRRNFRTLWLSGTNYHGSAALIDNRWLLTAAHNVFDYPASKLTALTVKCGEARIDDTDMSVTLNRAQIEDAISVPAYESYWINNPKKFEFDYAFIDLGRTLPTRSSFQLQSADRFGASAGPVHIGGYPGGTITPDGKSLYKGTSKNSYIDRNMMEYDIYTATGNSGGPVWIETDTPGKTYEIVAVHVTNSGGRVVNDRMIADWNAWRATR